MSERIGRLVMPALRWDGESYGDDSDAVDACLAAGVPGFILFGGTEVAARDATNRLRARAGRPLLFAADLERGAGQQFLGLPQLPPFAALAALDDAEVVREAGALTARGARTVGVDLVFAPVCDLSVEDENPIVGTRAAGDDPEAVARAVAAWIEGCLAEGVACCAKHWPGHGRTTSDSHAELPVVEVDAETLQADARPFAAAVAAGVPVVMTAHVAFPALDPSGAPATRSRPILDRLRALPFEGAVVTDALIMEGAGAPGEIEVGAIQAGVDLLLYPHDPFETARTLAAARRDGRLDPAAWERAVARVDHLVDAFAAPGAGSLPDPSRDRAAAAALADRVLEAASGLEEATGRAEWLRVRTFDDDVGGPYPPPSRDAFTNALLELGVPLGDEPSLVEEELRSCLAVIAVYGEPRAWKGRAGLSPQLCADVGAEVDRARSRGESPLVISFGGPRILADLRAVLGPGTSLLPAWGGEAGMQRAAARWLARSLSR